MAKNAYAILIVVTVMVGAALLLAAWPATAVPPAPEAAPVLENSTNLFPSPNERIGVGLAVRFGDITDYDVAQLQAGWWGDWNVRQRPPHPNGMDYVQLLPTDDASYPPNWDVLVRIIQSNPGSTWLIGNEPEGVFQENQTPAKYAPKYRELYTFIKAVDPTAKIGIGGVILPSPLRLQWLDAVMNRYQALYGTPMPVDVWNTHMQIVNEVSCSYDPGNCWGAEIPAGINAPYGIRMTTADNINFNLFRQLVVDMRTWMNNRGQRNKPLIISEYGVLMPSTYLCDGCTEQQGDILLANYMTRTFEYLLNATSATIGYPADGNRLVQRWMWYTLNDQPYDFETGRGFNGALFDYWNPVYPGTLTYFGHVFKSYVSALKVPYADLVPSGLLYQTSPGGQIIFTTLVANMGNTPVVSVTVRLYDGNPAAGGKQIGAERTIDAIGIRYSDPGRINFLWPNPPDNLIKRTFYVHVDSNGSIAESNETNNIAAFTLRFALEENRVYLPVITKNKVVVTP